MINIRISMMSIQYLLDAFPFSVFDSLSFFMSRPSRHFILIINSYNRSQEKFVFQRVGKGTKAFVMNNWSCRVGRSADHENIANLDLV